MDVSSLIRDSRRLIFTKRLLRNKNVTIGLTLTLFFITIALLAPVISPYNPAEGDLGRALRPPNPENIFGTDNLGRDVFSRVVWGARTSLIIASLGILIAVLTGGVLGAISGYIGGRLDDLIMRVVDILLAFPDILLAMFISAIVGPGLGNVILAIGVYNFPQFVRVARGAVMSVKNADYVEAARAIGEGKVSIIFRYVLPNALNPIVVHATLRTGASILTAAGLSFLGLGVQPPTPEWGSMISDAFQYLDIAPHMWICPGIFLMISVLGFNMLGDGLNDVLNPRIRE